MDFKTLYDTLARKAKSRNENFTFMEGNPRKFGHGAPDPDWALMTIREGVKQGIVSQQQAGDMSKHFAPHARFEHTENGEVNVRAHTRDGKPVTAHTRSAPDRAPAATQPFDGRTPPVAPQHYPPLDTPAQFPNPLDMKPDTKKYPHVEPHSQRPMPPARRTRTLLPPFEDTPLQPTPRRRPYGASLLHMADAPPTSAPAGDSTDNNTDGTQVAQLGQALRSSISNALKVGKGAAEANTHMNNSIDIADKEAHELLKGYGQRFKEEIIMQIEDRAEVNDGRLGNSDIRVVPDGKYNPKSPNEIKESDFYKLLKIDSTKGITTRGRARIRERNTVR